MKANATIGTYIPEVGNVTGEKEAQRARGLPVTVVYGDDEKQQVVDLTMWFDPPREGDQPAREVLRSLLPDLREALAELLEDPKLIRVP